MKPEYEEGTFAQQMQKASDAIANLGRELARSFLRAIHWTFILGRSLHPVVCDLCGVDYPDRLPCDVNPYGPQHNYPNRFGSKLGGE